MLHNSPIKWDAQKLKEGRAPEGSVAPGENTGTVFQRPHDPIKYAIEAAKDTARANKLRNGY